MARTVRNPKLDTRSARAKLKPRREPYWCSLAPGRALGYRRIGAQGGTWIAKLRIAGAGRWTHAVGPADDVLDAGGDVLAFAQAQERARAWFEEQERATAGQERPATSPFTVGNALDTYLAWYATHRKALSATRHVIETHIRPALGAVQVGQLNAQQIRGWHEALAASPRGVRTRPGAVPTPRKVTTDPEAMRARRATANRILTVLKAALNHTCHEGEAGSWARVKPFYGVDAARLRYLSEAECRRLLNACPENFGRLVRGALVTGCRYGELGRAEVRDFNTDAGTLLVRESKGGKPRWVPLDDEGRAFLELITAGRPGNETLFLRADGMPWGRSHQKRPLVEACTAARIEPAANFHALRHTWASHRVMKGAPLIVVAQVLGHADTRMVEKHYGHLAPSFVRDTVRATALDLGPLGTGTVAPIRPVANSDRDHRQSMVE